MAKGDQLGDFEQMVMLAILRLGDEAYGMRIRAELQERTGRDPAIGAVYATLERLAMKSLVTSVTGEPTEERGGRARRFFRVTPQGRRAVERALRDLTSMAEGLGLPAFGEGQ